MLKFKNGLAKDPNTGTWIYCFKINGTVSKGSTRAKDRVTAGKILEERRREVILEQKGLQSRIPTVKELLKIWTTAHRDIHSQKHLISVEGIIRLWVVPKIGDVRIDCVTARMVEDARQGMLDANRSPTTANLMIRSVRLLWRYSLRVGYIDSVPFVVHQMKVQRKPRPVVPVALVKEFFRVVDQSCRNPQSNTSTIYKTDSEQHAALRVTFPVSEIRTKEKGGEPLPYYEGFTIMQRLLDVLGTGLNITHSRPIIDHEKGRVEIEANLEIEWISGRKTVTCGWGSSDILISHTGKIVNDPVKAAATDSIKCAASKLGVAAELYDSKYRDGLAARLKELEDKEAEKALLTCQCCSGAIIGGTRKMHDGKELKMTAKEVAINTRKSFGKRYCLDCAGKEAQKAAVAKLPKA
jgi:hypothetical protein